jgi:hypothetical protein
MLLKTEKMSVFEHCMTIINFFQQCANAMCAES